MFESLHDACVARVNASYLSNTAWHRWVYFYVNYNKQIEFTPMVTKIKEQLCYAFNPLKRCRKTIIVKGFVSPCLKTMFTYAHLSCIFFFFLDKSSLVFLKQNSINWPGFRAFLNLRPPDHDLFNHRAIL